MDLNIDLRTRILHKSILLEDYLSKIIIRLIRVQKRELKTLGHKGSAFSFQTKADLLYDLERIDKNTYSDLKTFMEIRNQFIHNLDAISFDIVLKRLKKHNSFLKNSPQAENFIKEAENKEMREKVYEARLEELFQNISRNLIELEQEIIDEIELEQQNKLKIIAAEIYKDSLNLYDEAVDEFALEFQDVWSKAMGNKSMMGEIIKGAINKKLAFKLEEKYQIKLDKK